MFHSATALRSIDPFQRRAAVKELCLLGDTAPVSSLKFLLPLLNGPDEPVREGALQTVMNYSKTAGEVREAVLDHLKYPLISSKGVERMRVLRMIGLLGPHARSLVPTLVAGFTTTNAVVARMTSVALVSIGEDALPALESALNDLHPNVRTEASWALSKMTGKVYPGGS